MGAVTSILYSEMNLVKHQTHVSCMVLDSPFSKLSTMVDDVGQAQMGLPSFIISIGMSVLKSTIKGKINFDITKLDPLSSSKKLLIPAAFISAREDKLVLPKRMEEYYRSYRAKKKFLQSAHEHNSDREPEILETAFAFIVETLESETDEEIAKLGMDSTGYTKTRKHSEDDKYNRAKSRDLEYRLERIEKEELAMFFDKMDLMRDSPPKQLNRTNLSIFDDDEPTVMDFETRAKLMKLTGKSTTVGENSFVEPIKIKSIRSSENIPIISSPKPQPQEPSSRIRVLGQGNFGHFNQPTISQKNPADPVQGVIWQRKESVTYVTRLKEDHDQPPHSAVRSKSESVRPIIDKGSMLGRVHQEFDGEVDKND